MFRDGSLISLDKHKPIINYVFEVKLLPIL